MMSERERWFVYPILFLLLFATFYNAVTQQTSANFNSITCQQLVLTGPEGRQAAALVAGEAGAVLYLVRTEDGKTLAVGHDGAIQVSGAFAFPVGAEDQLVPLHVHGEKVEALRLLPWPGADAPKSNDAPESGNAE